MKIKRELMNIEIKRVKNQEIHYNV